MNKEHEIIIHDITQSDQPWIKDFYNERWGSIRVISRGILHNVPHLPGFIAWKSSTRVGLLTYQITAEELEIITLDSAEENIGVGSALIEKAIEIAKQLHHKRIWLITTNDNLPAIRFYQSKGFQLVAVHRNALEKSRQIKPEIPQIGLFGIPIQDEIELEISLNP
jgi:ribosomal protein S18 acetylase RimI-like enzyme